MASLVVGGVPFSSAAPVGELQDDLSDTREQLDEAEDNLDRTREQKGTAAEQVRAADVALAELSGRLVELEAQLAEAEAEAEAAGRRAVTAREELAELDEELREAEAFLAERERVLGDRAVAAYMFGPVSYAEVVVESRSVTEFVNTTYHLRTILDEDQRVVQDITDLTEQLALARAEADALRETVEAEQRTADAAVARTAALTEEQERVTGQAAQERARRAELLAELEVAEAATEAQIDELAAESAALEDQLRDAQWQAGTPGDGTWVWPTSGQITSPFGYRVHPIYGTSRLHAGTDIGAPSGQQIVAANDGLVVGAYCSAGGYGCRVVIDHGGGLATLYAHQSNIAVGEGAVVSAGQVIGYVGSTGASTGPHLHFEVRRNGVPENAMQFY